MDGPLAGQSREQQEEQPPADRIESLQSLAVVPLAGALIRSPQLRRVQSDPRGSLAASDGLGSLDPYSATFDIAQPSKLVEKVTVRPHELIDLAQHIRVRHAEDARLAAAADQAGVRSSWR
jgi:hypothetical protein